ncbi:MAG: ribose-phosphate diphosphokinase [Anaerolineae bacterium]
MESSICIFSGSAHRELAEEICSLRGIPLSPSVTRHFHNDNLYVQLQEPVRERDVFIIQPFYPPPVSDRILELLMMLDAARSASAKRVTAVIPYYSYSRSDKKDEPRISIAGRLIADLLVTAGAQRILTMTLHSPQVHGFFSVPTDHLSSMPVFASYFRDKDLSDTVIVTPDIGHAKRATELARELHLPVAAVSKKRIDDITVVAEGLIGEVRGKKAILIDDEIAVGTSMIEAIALLRRHGVQEATLVCTHGIFCGPAIENLKAVPEIKSIVTTNTVPIPPEKRIPCMEVLSVAPLFAEAIRRIHEGETMQPLFDY